MKDIAEMHNLSAEETKLVKDAQKALAKAKDAIADAREAAHALMVIQADAGRQQAAAQAYGFKAALGLALGQIETAHAVGTAALCDCFEDGGIVAFGAAGGD